MNDRESDIPRISKYGRIWMFRVAGVTLLALVIVLAFFPSLRDMVVGVFSRQTPAVISPTVESERTATAGAQAWSTLQQRPVRLPILTLGKACPVSPVSSVSYAGSVPGLVLGTSPVYAAGVGPSAIISYLDAHTFGTGQSAWGGQKVLWVIQPTYAGPVLIRGRRIDGTGDLRFNGGLDQQSYQGDWAVAPLLENLRLVGEPDDGSSWTTWPSYTRIQTAGCYAYQVDGLNFSDVIVFQALFT